MPTPKWKDALSKTMLLFSRSLEPEEWEVWRGFLDHLPTQPVELAFQNWQRNGRFFPKPKDILDLVETYKVAAQRLFKCCGTCDAEGWVTADNAMRRNTEGVLVPIKGRAVKRCSCWESWRASVKS